MQTQDLVEYLEQDVKSCNQLFTFIPYQPSFYNFITKYQLKSIQIELKSEELLPLSILMKNCNIKLNIISNSNKPMVQLALLNSKIQSQLILFLMTQKNLIKSKETLIFNSKIGKRQHVSHLIKLCSCQFELEF
ncbi:unnamed protein product [Paramecium octaurelia]|uniref:Uncharacterized protein n=1 Tax=Paramecium octaurelia TaxID=43137 RepID=A0A8S1XK56_PAROT|nr:unnamed protein product [Paramecium octaurelia]